MSDLSEEDDYFYFLILDSLKGFDLDIAPTGIEDGQEQRKQAFDFWQELLAACPDQERDKQIKWIRSQIPKYFRSLEQKPVWIQNPNWLFAGGKPMIFVNQIEVSRTDENLAGKFFHDDVNYYVFIPSYDLIDGNEHHPDRLILQRW